MVAYIYNITAAGNSIISQLGSSCQGQLVCHGKTGCYGLSIMYKITLAVSLSSSQQVGLPCLASPLAFGLIDHSLAKGMGILLKLVEI
jgi:hypothetical protein